MRGILISLYIIWNGVVLILLPGNAWAKTLAEVLAVTYRTNPALQSARADLREKDELLAQAISGYWPQISVTALEGRQDARISGGSGVSNTINTGLAGQNSNLSSQETQFTNETLTDRQVELTAVLNVYAGGRDEANVNYSRSVIAAGLAQLQSSEQTVLSAATRAYTDIVYYTLLLELASQSVEDLLKLKEMTDSLFSKQLTTITSAAQVDSNLASARIGYDASMGNLQAAKTRYIAVVGEAAPELTDWPKLPDAPDSLEQSLNHVVTDNLDIRFAKNMLEASKYSLRVNEAALLPVIDLYNSLAWYWDKTRYTNPGDFSENDSERLWSFGVQFTMPIYQGGENYSKVRQSKQAVISRQFDLNNTRNQAEQQVRASWIGLNTARRQLQYALNQIKYATTAYQGLQAEFKSGSVTMNDVLTGQTELIDAQASKYQAIYDEINSLLDLLVALGRFQALSLKLPVDYYDPEKHLKEVRYKRFGLD